MNKGMSIVIPCLLVASALGGPADRALAQDRVVSGGDKAVGFKTRAGEASYIVVLDAPTLVDEVRAMDQTLQQGSGAASPRTPRGKLDLRSQVAVARKIDMESRFETFRAEASSVIGRELQPVHRYTAALNGFSAHLTAREVARLAAMPGVRSVHLDETFKLETYAGPTWIGASRVWNGQGGLQANRGAGVVIGIIDSGINWEHPSFDDPGEGLAVVNPDAFDHENPYGETLGICGDPVTGGAGTVECNDKLVGIYDFVQDNPNTDVVEEFNSGADNGTHGAHTASTAAGNPVSFSLNGDLQSLSGVAPHANVVSYRVCYAGDPDDPDDDACQSSAITRAIDQAIQDGVDIINYSVGGSAFDPWAAPDTLAFREAVEAGIFVATSAGNAGPSPGTMGRPANAPWITAAGSATHDRVLAGVLQNLDGGATTPPSDLVGTTLTAEALPDAPVVYAGDFGFPLCGTGEPELAPTCEGNTGATNPFAPGTFDGEIVVCDRGSYGRVEKGKNVLEAGAGGFVLLNTPSNGGEVTVEDNHCLPSTHLSASRGAVLKNWLASGSGHTGSLSGFGIVSDEGAADRMSDFSSRGPTPAPAQDIMKPNVIAPGDLIFAAGPEESQIVALGGTSMASPHVAGAAALMLSARPNLTPAQLASMLELSATDALAKDENFNEATHFDTGAGRVRVDQALRTGLFLEQSVTGFIAADPGLNGDPKTLNLASMTDSDCRGSCSFTRTVGALVGGQTWTTSTSGFPDGVLVTVTPDSFTLAEGEEQAIDVTVDWSGAQSEVAGDWFFGKVNIDSPSRPTAALPVSAYASFGDLPPEWVISTAQSSGSEDFSVSGLEQLDGATFTTGGFESADETTFELAEDPTFDDPFDGGQGTITLLFDVPQDALWFHTDTPPSAPEDVDLFVGFDSNGDGQAQESELICQSTTFTDVEFCDIFIPDAGTWWVVVQNWEDGVQTDPGPSQEITLVSTVVAASDDSQLMASGPGMAERLADIDVRLAWDRVSVPTGRTLYGAVAIGSEPGSLADVGVVPVRLERLGIAEPKTRALMAGRETAFALRANTAHEQLYIDVPPGVSSLNVNIAGASVSQNNALELDLRRAPFDQSFGQAPEAVIPGNAVNVLSAAGSGGQGPSATIDNSVEAGRWFVVVTNTAGTPASVRVQVELSYSGSSVNVLGGLWEPVSRPGINQGFEYTPAGSTRAFLWYTYEEDSSPAWYLASGGAAEGNVWTADLFRFTNNGVEQQGTRVGDVSITMLGRSDAVLNWTLHGESGSDRVKPLSRTCPEVNSPPVSYTGLWYRGSDGLGGASVVANRTSQAHIHYLYDGAGKPRWLLASGAFSAATLPLSQFWGFPPNGSGSTTSQVVGEVDVAYDDTGNGVWSLDYQFEIPAFGGTVRDEDIVKLSDDLACTN